MEEMLYRVLEKENTDGDTTEYYVILAEKIRAADDWLKEKAWKYESFM